MASQILPRCTNEACPRSQVQVDREEPGKFVTLVCLTCHGTQIITQDHYSREIRLELARRHRQGEQRPLRVMSVGRVLH